MGARVAIVPILLLVGATTLGSLGCVRPMIGPMIGSSPATATRTRGASELYFEETARRSASPTPPCARDLPLVTANAAAMRGHEVISRISATCPPLLPGECDQHLRERACAAGADAVVLDEGTDGVALGADYQPQRRVVSGALVRWTP